MRSYVFMLLGFIAAISVLALTSWDNTNARSLQSVEELCGKFESGAVRQYCEKLAEKVGAEEAAAQLGDHVTAAKRASPSSDSPSDSPSSDSPSSDSPSSDSSSDDDDSSSSSSDDDDSSSSSSSSDDDDSSSSSDDDDSDYFA
eukprot:CAMPEP_0170738142 /NCGR_PEP_ID=MMETSP0437-20130122/4495_1 /TAXON_ID=0 /ORGANISM="Sexangularia sp." /LENGTH=143 /DNA_ID=CAMNT_0011076561 /DNA_START=64 /DNA_END=495 /DNA_ORIENTATION=+